MRKIIKNKQYDTDKAKLVASIGSEMLYQKKTGEFFLFDTENIIPVSKEDAKHWAESRNIDESIYNAYFVPGTDNSFASKLKDARSKNGFSQARMSEVLEVPKRTIEDWERGSMNPPAYVEKLILEKLYSMAKK